MKLRTAIFLALVLLLIGVPVLAVIYNNRVEFQGTVNVVSASPGLTITPTQVNFPDIAPGIWGDPVPVAVLNTGMDTYTSLRLESTSPEGLGLYMLTPPIMPLPPGGSVVVPLTMYAQPSFPPTDGITFTGWIIGEK